MYLGTYKAALDLNFRDFVRKCDAVAILSIKSLPLAINVMT